MADYTSSKTGAQIDTILGGTFGSDVAITSPVNNQLRLAYNASNSCDYGYVGITVNNSNPFTVTTGGAERMRINSSGSLLLGTATAIGTNRLEIECNAATIGGVALREVYPTSGTANSVEIFRVGVKVGSITNTLSSTSYNTSSDPRLKDFKIAPTDAEVNAKFDDLFGCFKTFNWKSDVDGELVWGFDAHATIDAGLDMGTEGEGPRELALGDVYKTTPAELDEDGVEIKAAIEHKVSPAGVDQSKAVPILLAKIEQLERRLKALEV